MTRSVLDIRLVLFLHFEMERLSGDIENQNTERTHTLIVVKIITDEACWIHVQLR